MSRRGVDRRERSRRRDDLPLSPPPRTSSRVSQRQDGTRSPSSSPSAIPLRASPRVRPPSSPLVPAAPPHWQHPRLLPPRGARRTCSPSASVWVCPALSKHKPRSGSSLTLSILAPNSPKLTSRRKPPRAFLFSSSQTRWPSSPPSSPLPLPTSPRPSTTSSQRLTAAAPSSPSPPSQLTQRSTTPAHPSAAPPSRPTATKSVRAVSRTRGGGGA